MGELRAFSAPGKALLVGGYLVLDRQFNSYAVALSSRMHAVVKAGDGAKGNRIIVKSPQFVGGEWEYLVQKDATKGFILEETNGRTNPFVLSAIETVLYYVYPDELFDVEINIFSDSAYHSTDDTIVKASGQKTFLYHSKQITEVAKTGLGSSAGLVTVLTTALLSFFSTEFDLGTSSSTKNKIHNLAQIAHCQAQGKVGSGFDVAAATFGSIVYRRFDPSLINNLTNNSTPESYHTQLKTLVDAQDWEIRVDPVTLPKGIKLIMGDVKTGSNTPKLVSKVLAWRASDPESPVIYENLNNANMEFVECLQSLKKIDETESYHKALSFVNDHTIEEVLAVQNNEDLATFKKLINSVTKIRENLREITKRSGADIEPAEQTQLLDNCSTIKGVLAGVVPGAGGYDAISLLITENAVENLKTITDGNADFNGVEWLELSQESNGIQEESESDYLGFL